MNPTEQLINKLEGIKIEDPSDVRHFQRLKAKTELERSDVVWMTALYNRKGVKYNESILAHRGPTTPFVYGTNSPA